MAKSRSLILAYIDKRPDAAGRALAGMEPDDAAALLEGIPTRFATRVLTHMGTWAACGLLQRMAAHKAGAILGGFNYQHAASLVRLMTAAVRNRLLRELPAELQSDLHTTLSYPRDSVGAHMTVSILTQRMDHTVGDARDQIRRATGADTGCVIVVDDNHRLAGVVPLVALFRYARSTPLEDVMESDVAPVSARARIAAVRDLDGWDRYSSLPVVSRRKHIIGTLNRAALRPAAVVTPVPGTTSPQGLPGALADALIGFVAGLAHLARQGSGPGISDSGNRR